MFSYGNDFTGVGSGHALEQNNDFSFHGYPLDVSNSGSSTSTAQTIGYNSDARIAGPSTASIENWWLRPSPNAESSQYPGSIVLNASWNGFTDNFQIGPTSGGNAFETNGVEGLAGSSRVIQPAFPPSLPLATPFDPTVAPSLPPAQSWGYSSFCATSSMATGSHQSGMYDQLLSMPSSSGQWPCPTSIDKGKSRATDHVPPPIHPTANDTMWQNQQPRTPQHYYEGSIPYTNTSLLNTELSAAVASSSGPQRSKRGATRREKETEEGTGARKRTLKRTLSPDINWAQTCDRFYWEMVETYMLQPSGGLPTPMAAYARIKKFIKEDLHQSPLSVKKLGVRPIREQEQYLIGILDTLYPAREGDKRDIQRLLDQVAQEIEHGLFMVNDAVALRDGPLKKAKPEDLDESAEKGRHRKVEKKRRATSHETLGGMSFFFKAPPRSLSRNKVLFFAITYLMFGAEGFGDDGFIIALPKL